MIKTNSSSSLRVMGAVSLLLASSVSQAAITAISDDFESYGTAGVPSAADFSPWFGYSDNGGFPGGYTFTPSTSGPQIAALGYNGSDNQYFNFYANYDNANVHDRVNCGPCSPNLQEQIFAYRQMSFTSADTANGDTWVFKFDYRDADVPPGGSTQVAAYIRVFDPVFNILDEVSLDTAGAADWTNGRLSITLDPLWVNGFFQIGFYNTTGNYEDSGVYYDNVELVKAEPALVRIRSIGDTLHPHHNDESTSPFLDDVVRVIVLGSSTAVGDPSDIDTDLVDVDTLRFGPGLTQTAAGHPPVFNLDNDNDGLEDARFNFLMSESEISCSDTEATLTGDLLTGETFVGVDGFNTNCNAQCH